MRVILFIGTLTTGGAQRQAVCIARGLAQKGVDLHLVSVYPGGDLWAEAEAEPLIKLHSLFARQPKARLVRALSLFAVPGKLRSLMAQIRPDVIYSMLDLTNVFARMATRGRDQPKLVWGVRSAARPNDYRARIPFWMSRKLSGQVPLIIANSQSGLDFLSDSGFLIRKGVVIQNGIDSDRFRFDPEGRVRLRERWGLTDDNVAVGVIGRLDPLKGHDDFLSMAAECHRARPEMRFFCVGPGLEDRSARLVDVARSLSIDHVVKFVGPAEEMKAVYSAIDVVVSTSIGEGFPNVIAEAMACRRPCAVTDVGDSAILVGDCGVVVPPGEPLAMSEAVPDIVDRRDELGHCGRSRVTSEFSVGTMIDRTLEALSS